MPRFGPVRAITGVEDDVRMVTSNFYFIDSRKELLHEVGRVTVRWAALDLLLVEILAVVLENDIAAYQLVFRTSSFGRERLELVKDLIGGSKLDAGERESIFACISKLKTLLTERNTIVHSPLVMHFGVKGSKLTMKVQRVMRDGAQRDVTIEGIKAHVENVTATLEKLEEIQTDLAEKYQTATG